MSLISRIGDFCRNNIIATIIGATSLGASGTAATFWSLYEAKINRVEDMKVAEFNDLVNETKKFRELLNAFTNGNGVKWKSDPEKRSEIAASLVRLYSGLDAFTVNIQPGQELSVKRLQTSINELKKQVQLTKSQNDLNMFYLRLATMFEDFSAAKPVLESAVGKQFNEAG